MTGPKRRARTKRDPFEREIEAALAPGRFIGFRSGVSFVRTLESAADRIGALVPEQGARAAKLYETFLAGCYEKSGEVDDSGGDFGELMQSLCCRWVQARQAARSEPEETVPILLRWMDRDGYGYTYQLEEKLVEVLDEAGLRALARKARDRLDDASKDEASGSDRHADFAREHWADVLRAVYRARGDAPAYVELCEGMGGMTAKDCLAVARIYESGGDVEHALSWVRRGLDGLRLSGDRDFAKYELRRRERALLSRLGRCDEALSLAWKEFEARPSTFGFEELMHYVPADELLLWRGRALDCARGASLDAAVELFIELRETDLLAERLSSADEASARALGHYQLERAAKLLRDERPDLGARLYRSLGMRIVDEAKSKYYRSALSHLARAKRYYEKAGLLHEWEGVVQDVRERHRRKTSFMPGFERIVRGERRERSSYLDRARQRFRGGDGGRG